MGVRVNFTSQSTTAALSIENGSLFEGESEFEKLKIYLITLVSIRSDWEDLPWLFRSVENLSGKTMSYNEMTGVYSCQVDEQWFDLSDDLLRKALAITPVNPTHPFELPPSGDTVIDFVNELGYPEPVENVSSIRVNYVYQPWRAILSLFNQCLTGKTSGSDKPRHPVLQSCRELSLKLMFDHAELIWGRVTKDPAFFSHKASLYATHHEKGEEEGNDADLERAIKLSLDPAFLPQGRAPIGGVTIRNPVSEATPKLHEVVGKGKVVVTKEQVAHSLIDLSKEEKNYMLQFILVVGVINLLLIRQLNLVSTVVDTSEKVIHESSSTSDSKRTESETEAAAPKGDKDQDELDTSTVTSGVSIPVSDSDKAL
ncbi:hypothetical protein Tco_1125588 [Tanacetum coccineum]|uniref:Uncharacterized protein n=1 Tax=Tanacetum coccineum TaxID=301880 RepID=A0ABQ5J9I4_9ASTR